MSNVYIVFMYYHYEGAYVLKVFSNESAAIKFIDNYVEEQEELGYNWYKKNEYGNVKYNWTNHCADLYYEEIELVEELREKSR